MVAVCLCTAGAIAQTADSLKMINLQEVVVKGVRAQQNAPFAVANFKKSELQSFGKTGRELPFLFANTPGVVRTVLASVPATSASVALPTAVST